MSLSVVLLADAHVDHQTPTGDSLAAWDAACAQIAESAPNLLVLCGDIFDTGNPRGEYVAHVAHSLKALADPKRGPGVRVLYVLGNHEWIGVRAGRGHRSAAAALGAVPGVRVVDRPTMLRSPCGLAIAVLPWARPGGGADMLAQHNDQIERVADQIAAVDGPKLAVGHAAVAESVPFAGSECDLAPQSSAWTLPADQLDRREVWEQLWLGHVHNPHTPAEAVSYVGSLEALTFADEGRTTGYVSAVWDNGWIETAVPCGTRRFATLQLAQLETATVDQLAPGTVVRVRVSPDEMEHQADLGRLKQAGLRFAGYVYTQPAAVVDSDMSEMPQVERGVAAPADYLPLWAERRRLNSQERTLLARAASEALGWETALESAGR